MQTERHHLERACFLPVNVKALPTSVQMPSTDVKVKRSATDVALKLSLLGIVGISRKQQSGETMRKKDEYHPFSCIYLVVSRFFVDPQAS